MSEGQTAKTKLVLCCIGAAVVGAGLWHFLSDHFGGDDSPIVVRDGSVIMESTQNYPFRPTYWLVPNLVDQPSYWLVHEKSNWKLKHFSKSSDTKLRKCRGGTCKLVVTLNDADSSTIIFETKNNGKGLSIYSSIDYNSDRWNKTDPRIWVLGNGSLKIKDVKMTGTNKDDGTPEDPDKVLCTGSACGDVRVHYEQ